MDHQQRLNEAKNRGRTAGQEAAKAGRPDDWSPLSGEWAGESIPELLGDLLPGENDDEDEEIKDAYADAAEEAFQLARAPERCDSCEEVMINGVRCHETGCPNAKRVNDDDEPEDLDDRCDYCVEHGIENCRHIGM